MASIRFGEFELDQERRQLLRSGQPVPLEPKACTSRGWASALAPFA